MSDTLTPEHTDAPEGASTPTGGTTPADAKTSKPRSRPAKGNPTLRHHVELTLRVAAMNEAQRTLLCAASYAPSIEVADLVIEVLSNEAEVRNVLSVLTEIATADPMESGIRATVLATDRKAAFKTAWRVLSALIGVDAPVQLPNLIPPATATAGLAFAKAAQALDDGARKSLTKLTKDLTK